MSNPAIEAARRAEANNGDWPWDTTRDAMETAADEALKPVREWYERQPAGGFVSKAAERELAELIYPSEELQ